jgi:hypothetical protein
MPQQLRERYGFEQWVEREIDGAFVTTIGFVPWEEDLRGRAFQRLKDRRIDGLRSVRGEIAAPQKGGTTVYMDCHEHASAAAARAYLLDMLGNNQLAELQRGPDGLGDIAFMHPSGMAAGVFFARGNLTVAVNGGAGDAEYALALAAAMDHRIASREGLIPVADLALEPGEENLRGRLEALSRKPEARRTAKGYLKLFTRGARLLVDTERAALEPAGEAPVRLEVFVADPPQGSAPPWPGKVD